MIPVYSGENSKEQLTPQEVYNGPKPNLVIREVEGLLALDCWRALEQQEAISSSEPALNSSVYRNSPPTGNYNYYDVSGDIRAIKGNSNWALYAYGIRTKLGDDGLYYREFTTLEDLERIHGHLASTVLNGEHARVSRLVVPPDPKNGTSSFENQDFWLQELRHNKWPIMLLENSDGSKSYNSHDYADFHTFNMLFFPRELQGIITEAIIHEQAQRAIWEKGISGKPKIMLLPGENAEDDPYACFKRSGSAYSDGITKIDNLTDAEHYMRLLNHLVYSPGQTVEDNFIALKQYIEGKGTVSEEISWAVGGYEELVRLVRDIVNFNSRHREGRQAVPELIDWEIEKVMNGVVRVAKKIRGEYQEAA